MIYVAFIKSLCPGPPQVEMCTLALNTSAFSPALLVKSGLMNFYSNVWKCCLGYGTPSCSPITPYLVAGMSSICLSSSLSYPNRIIPIWPSPILSAKGFRRVAPQMVVAMTTRRERVSMKERC